MFYILFLILYQIYLITSSANHYLTRKGAKEIKTKYIDEKNVIETQIDTQKQRIELLERNNLDQEKKDMWDD